MESKTHFVYDVKMKSWNLFIPRYLESCVEFKSLKSFQLCGPLGETLAKIHVLESFLTYDS